MEVPVDVLQILKCQECNGYLSCGPVYMQHSSGHVLCGRCSRSNNDVCEKEPAPDKDSQTRYKQYEAVATLLAFPCRYAEYGCKKKLEFTIGKINLHEVSCEYKQHVCPIVSNQQCDWIGHWSKLYQHCCSKHKKHILMNPCVMRHDVSKAFFKTFITYEFNVLFLLYVNICKQTGNIYHSVRYLEGEGNPEDYSFKVEIERNLIKICKTGHILSEQTLLQHEPGFVVTNIKNLLGILDGYCGTTFTITIEKPTSRARKINCKFCCREMSNSFGDTDNKNICCANCKPKIQYCMNRSKGCSYIDIEAKCKKHECYYCVYGNCCPVEQCNYTFVKHFKMHYKVFHNAMEVPTNAMLPIPNTNEPVLIRRYVMINNSIGTIFCNYVFRNKETIDMYIRTPLSYTELQMYQCAVIFSNPVTTYYRKMCSQNIYDDFIDWYVNFMCDHKFRNNDAVCLEFRVQIKKIRC